MPERSITYPQMGRNLEATSEEFMGKKEIQMDVLKDSRNEQGKTGGYIKYFDISNLTR